MPATAYNQLALSGCLALVEHPARAHLEQAATTREYAVELSAMALEVLTGRTSAPARED